MGRKRWWRGGLVELLVLHVLHHAVVLADGDVGEYTTTEYHYSTEGREGERESSGVIWLFKLLPPREWGIRKLLGLSEFRRPDEKSPLLPPGRRESCAFNRSRSILDFQRRDMMTRLSLISNAQLIQAFHWKCFETVDARGFPWDSTSEWSSCEFSSRQNEAFEVKTRWSVFRPMSFYDRAIRCRASRNQAETPFAR